MRIGSFLGMILRPLRRSYKVFALVLALALVSSALAFAQTDSPSSGQPPTISSDKLDYAPGETVVLTGENWQPGEVVRVQVDAGSGYDWSRDTEVTVADDGTITDQFQLPDFVVPRYTVTATGPVSGKAATSFTDGNVVAGANLPTSASWTLTKTTYTGSTNCSTGAGSPSTVSLQGTNTDTTAVTSSNSIKLEAPASSSDSREFKSWSSSDSFTVISGTNGQAICVRGPFGTATQTYTANYDVDPAITLPGAALSYTENAAATRIDTTATATDTDSTNLNTGTLTIDFSANGTADDRLAIRNQGTGAGQIGVSGSNVTFSGTTIGTFTGGSGTTPLVVTFNSSSSPAAAQALMRNITYANVSDAPSTASRTVRFVLTDGDGGTSNTATKTINVTAVNDTPTADGQSVSTNEDTAKTITLSGSDIDGNTLSFSTVSAPTHGTLGTIGTASCTGTAPKNCTANVTYTPSADYNGSDSFTFRVNDGTVNSTSATVSITITAVNDAPTISLPGGSLAYTENAAATVIDSGATAADVDSADFNTGTLTIDYSAGGTADDRLAIRNQGTGAGQIGVSGSNVTFSGTTIGTFTGGSGTTPLVVTFNSSSSPAAAQALMRNITYANVSDAPSTTARTVRFVLTDGDGGTSNTATKTINVNSVNDAPTISDISDQTTNEDTATSAIPFTVGDVDNAATSLTVTGSSSDTTLVPNANISFGGSGANRTVTVTPAANQSGTATITVSVSDGIATTSDTFVLTVNAVNDAPVNTVPGAQSSNEDTPLIFSNANSNRILISDVDAGSNPVQTTLSVTHGTLTLPSTIGLIFSAGANGTANMTFTGTVASINSALNGLRFDPTANYNGSASLTISTNDRGNSGTGGAQSDTDTIAITVTAVNDPPTISDIPDQSTEKDVPTAPIPFTIRDQETAAEDLRLTGSSDNQTLVPDANITFDGTGTDRRLTITPAPGQVGTAMITITVSDGTGSGSLTASDTFRVTVSETPPDKPSVGLDTTSDSGASHTDNITNDNTPTFSGTAEPNSTVEVFDGSTSLGTVTANAHGDYSFTVPTPRSLTDGIHSITAKATNNAGTSPASTALSITIDTAAPQTTIGSGPSGTVASGSASFAFSASEANSTFECKLDSGTFAPCTSSKDYTALQDGEHTFRVQATDAAGNTGAAASRTWTVNTTPPPPPSEKETSVGDVSTGGTVTTDTENDGATASDPVETSVTTPVAGEISITEATITDQPPASYSLIGQQVDIKAPNATPQNPLKLVFLLDSSRVPQGEDQNTVQIFRNGTQVQNCTGAAGVASPDPCVSERRLLSGGNLQFTVLTSAASRWTFGVPTHTPAPQPSPPPGTAPPSPPPGTASPSPTPIGGGDSKGHKSKRHHKKHSPKKHSPKGHGKHKQRSGNAIVQR